MLPSQGAGGDVRPHRRRVGDLRHLRPRLPLLPGEERRRADDRPSSGRRSSSASASSPAASPCISRCRALPARAAVAASSSGGCSPSPWGRCSSPAPAVEWKHLIGEGLTIQTNLFGTTYYSLVGLHAFHVLVGLVLLGAVAVLRLLRPGGPGAGGAGRRALPLLALRRRGLGGGVHRRLPGGALA